MVRNRVLKKILKGSIFKVLSIINIVTPKFENSIMLYSANKGMSFNLLPLRDYLLENKYNRKYKIICGVEGKKYKETEMENVAYVTPVQSVFLYLFTKHVFYTTGQIPIKPSGKQNVVHLRHGASDFKTVGKLSKIHNGDEYYFNHMLATSEIYRPIEIQEYGCREKDIFLCGEPMTDAFYQKPPRADFGSYDKILLWAPTFRQSDYLGYSDSSQEQILPLFEEDEYEKLNAFLSKCRYLLIVKIHPSQNMRGCKKRKFSNLRIYSHEDFLKENLDLYQLLPQVDVLLADYSSVFLQFLLLDKPIGFVVPDMEEYRRKRGFVFDDPEEYMPGEIIKTKEGFYQFLDNVRQGEDQYQEDRKRVRDKVHKYQDGNNCKRILQRFGIVLDREEKPWGKF